MKRIAQAPPDSGRVALGRTLPSLLAEAVRENPNPTALNQRTDDGGWIPMSLETFRRRSQHLALAFRDAGLRAGDRVALFTHSDTSFCLADMGSLIAGLVDVPIYITHAEAAMRHILVESEARALVVSDAALYETIAPVVARLAAAGEGNLEFVAFVATPASMPELPDGLGGTTFDALEARGAELHAEDPERAQRYEDALDASDLATLLYTSGTTGLPKGVMLSHENISSNAIASFTGLTTLKRGPEEVVLSFLPLTHIFARTLQYANFWYGVSTYYSHPDLIREDFQTVRPTMFASVPRVLERAFERIQATGAALTGFKRRVFDWSMKVAARYDVEAPLTGFDGLQLKVADRLVLSKWREALGGRVRTIPVGGAALRAELVNMFGAAGIDILQGYGLTETSPVVSFNRAGFNRAGSVGPALAGTEMAIADDDEVLARGPHIMLGYYRQPELTEEVIDDDGWLHTGDLGSIDEDGYLTITGRKKNLFKLSTGKYVCAALVFVAPGALEERAFDDADLRRELIEALERGNEDLPPWSAVKRAALIEAELTIENGALTPKMSVKRSVVLERFADAQALLFGHRTAPVEGCAIVDVAGRPASTEG